MTKDALLNQLRDGSAMTFGQLLNLVARLSMPAMLAQVSIILMEYIDAAMVGSLGADASASIGLVSTTTWLFGGLCSAVNSGFCVQVAHRIGGRENAEARRVLREAITTALLLSLAVGLFGAAISGALPEWLGGNPAIREDASTYFLIFSCSIPLMQLYFLTGGMLRSSGNVMVPSLISVAACVLDVAMNFFCIFPTRTLDFPGGHLTIPGLGLGVAGAALGTMLAFVVATAILMAFLCLGSKELRLTQDSGSYRPRRRTLKRAFRIGFPMGLQHVVMNTAQIVITIIVAPLGSVAIAANSFAITAESLCYMPGYGISDAATTLVGQSLGARRPELMRRFAHITVGAGMLVMTIMGIVLFIAAPVMMDILSPVEQVRTLGTDCLRIEAWAEPMFAASIVSYGVFVGTGDTLKPSLMNFLSMWAVRLTLAALLAPSLGLQGVWLAMCVELCFRGAIFLLRLRWYFRHKASDVITEFST